MKGDTDGDERPKSYDPERVRTEKSFGVTGDKHWANARKDMHEEEIAFLRERSQAPGVAEGGGLRNHYCMECHGVIELSYDSTEASSGGPPEHCPHCGAEVDQSVRMMFNWVEIDQVPGSDFKALLPFFIAGGLLFVALLWWLFA